MKPVYLLVGVPAAGKSWVCSQLENFCVIQHDDYIGENYSHVLKTMSRLCQNKPILAETPFSMSKIVDSLSVAGIKVIPIFVIADEKVLNERWKQRGIADKTIKGHLSRQNTYLARAKEAGHFYGDSNQVLEFLKQIK